MTVTLSNTSTFGVPVVTVAWLMGLVAALSAHALLKKEVDDDFNTFNDFINIDNVFRESPNPNEYYSGHFNKRGNKIVSDILIKNILKN